MITLNRDAKIFVIILKFHALYYFCGLDYLMLMICLVKIIFDYFFRSDDLHRSICMCWEWNFVWHRTARIIHMAGGWNFMGKVIEGMFRSPSRLGSEAGYRTHKIFFNFDLAIVYFSTWHCKFSLL